jgi:AcrR family transcriptional regulator
MARDGNPETARTRARILDAAVELATGGSGSRISVRAVAARAGVGIGTLRYHFPTQRELLDAALSSIYERAMPDDRIHDTSVPARERLLECLRQAIAPVGTGRRARETWAELFAAFIDPAASSEHRGGYLELSRQAHRRIESWLSILCEQGALETGDNAARARLLVTLLNGLAVQRALPSDRAALETETEVLEAAVDRLLGGPPRAIGD